MDDYELSDLKNANLNDATLVSKVLKTNDTFFPLLPVQRGILMYGLETFVTVIVLLRFSLAHDRFL